MLARPSAVRSPAPGIRIDSAHLTARGSCPLNFSTLDLFHRPTRSALHPYVGDTPLFPQGIYVFRQRMLFDRTSLVRVEAHAYRVV